MLMEGAKNATPDSGGGVTTLSNMTVNNVTYSRADLVAANDEMALTVIPVMLILGVMMVLGILGNSLVCFVFCFRLGPSTQNYLIVYLAVFDLLSSTIGIPSEIADMRYIIMFESEAACKIMRFVESFCAMGSIFALVVIAVDRFRKVCRPLKSQFRVVHIKFCLIPIIGIALFLSWPALFTNGLRTTESGVPGFPGTDCSAAVLVEGIHFSIIYYGFLFILFVVITMSQMIIYCCVFRATKRHIRYMKKNSGMHFTQSQPVHNEDDANAGHHSLPVTLATQISLPREDKLQVTSEIPRACTGSVGLPVPEPKATSGSSPGEEMKKNKGKRSHRFKNKTTVIAFLVTLVFILSFLPYLCLQLATMRFKGFDAKLKGARLVFYNIFVRSYFFNSVLNPFIYGALNTKFKEEVHRLAKKFKSFCNRT